MTPVRSAPHCAAMSGARGGQRHGRGERIRTSGPCLPKTVLYQAELLPDRYARPFRRPAGLGVYRDGVGAVQADGVLR